LSYRPVFKYWLSCFLVKRVRPAPLAILFHLDPVRIVGLALFCCVIPALALGAGHCDTYSHLSYRSILMTLPAPTVLPPSRMVKRCPSSMAIGVISSTSISVLSPGITISTPSARAMVPVTSVVRK